MENELSKNKHKFPVVNWLGIAKTIGELREIIKNYPDNTPFGFRNQPMQELQELIYQDNLLYVVFGGTKEIYTDNILKSKKRLYFRKGDDNCYTIKSHLQYMIENHIEEMDIFLAKRETNVPYFLCKHFGEIGEKSESDCGKMCIAYKPRNGKSGACIFVGYLYEQTDQCFSLKIDSVLF